MSSVRERQGRRKEWESGGHIIQFSVFGFSKNSHVLREGGDEYQKICLSCLFPLPSSKVRGWQGVVAGRSKCQATGRSWALGESSGAGRSPEGRATGLSGRRNCEGIQALKAVSQSTLSHHMPYISRQLSTLFSVLIFCVQGFFWLDILVHAQCPQATWALGMGFQCTGFSQPLSQDSKILALVPWHMSCLGLQSSDRYVFNT